MQGLSQLPESLTPDGPNDGFAVTSHTGSRLEGHFSGTHGTPCVCVFAKGCAQVTDVSAFPFILGMPPRKSRKIQSHHHNASPPPSAHGKGKIDLSGAETQALKVWDVWMSKGVGCLVWGVSIHVVHPTPLLIQSFFVDGGGRAAEAEGSARSLHPTPKEPSILVKLDGGQLRVRCVACLVLPCHVLLGYRTTSSSPSLHTYARGTTGRSAGWTPSSGSSDSATSTTASGRNDDDAMNVMSFFASEHTFMLLLL